ncbi:hypothetical protein JAAARDRAFT_126720, partial [Jaapia argillacea MUCL 33604]
DPAIERWNHMREAAYKHFRFTPRSTWIVFCGLVLVPGTVYYLNSSSDMKYSWDGKRRGESLTGIQVQAQR